ncbi:hypothetical protein ILUMI_05635 [Ignelater luminosus]|uniref:SIAH-type domain-containing protein n=1 Tax=Ignelater luminosus TaxID=2038154 RepID=A0A8K0D7C8_IGNLU|nr:hypothetical protein ILUMI_05635 [Ignelater luminosus]
MDDITDIMGNNLLTELNCSICKSLLSAPPILLDHDGHNICGRCKINTDLKHIHNVHYEVLATQFEFPCQFIKEGCTVKKSFGTIKLHEEKCLYRTVKCDIGKCEWYGKLHGFILHCSNTHQDSVMNINDLRKLENDGEGCYILDVIGFYFLIKWKLVKSKFELQLENILHTEINFVFDINLFKLNNTKVPIKTLDNIKPNTKDVSFNFQESHKSLVISFTINSLSFITANNIDSDYSQKIICSYCNHQMVSPIWQCHLGHITCVDCTEYDYDLCKGCDDVGVAFTRVPELEVLTLISTYTCKSCAENFTFVDIQEHEKNCIKRVYECPHCKDWHGRISEVIPHDSESCKRSYSHECMMAAEVTISGNDNTCEYRLVAYNDLFCIIFEELSLGINVMIDYYGCSSLLGWYEYEAVLYHDVDPNFPFNKTYKNAHRCYNQYLIEIPNSDIDKFGEKRPFKITVKIHLLHGIARNMSVGKILKLNNMNQ